ncbi:hypothetical protein PF008_g18319 [Phytophthora fragariae]|uniref:Uncharacterized protein n=1 Tax=Phytophthora fragariae TaxID=53985 RepID=A0A6G0R624_9STRA|nr:hypothetical protein PF008_g18319 [Phytophthora fragariae]
MYFPPALFLWHVMLYPTGCRSSLYCNRFDTRPDKWRFLLQYTPDQNLACDA